MKKFVQVLATLALLLAAPISEAKNCVTTQPCGNSCISWNKVCHLEGTKVTTPTTPTKPAIPSTSPTTPSTSVSTFTPATRALLPSPVYMGTPKTAFPVKLLTRQGFAIGYDEEKHNPAWVFYYVPRGDAKHSPNRPEKFSSDPEINAPTLSKDYDRSGFDRGHMAPNFAIGTRYGVAAQNQTFLMSNIAPQKPGLNRGVWKEVEALIAKDTGYANRFNGVWVVVGPIYYSGRRHSKLAGGEWVPDAFYQIIVKEENSQPNALAFIIPQEVESHSKPQDYLTSIAEIEKVTGIVFFYQLPKQAESNLENSKPKTVW